MEGQPTIYPYLNALDRAFLSGSLDNCKQLFKLDNQLLQQAVFGLRQISITQARGACHSKFDPPWQDVVFAHIKAAQQRVEGNSAAAFDLYTAKEGSPIKALVEVLEKQPEAVWVAGIFEQLLENVMQLTREADKQLFLVDEDSKFKTLGTFLQPVQHGLGGAPREGEPGRQRASLTLLITMTRIYAKLNNMQGCTSMVKAFKERYSGNIARTIPPGLRVAAWFYLGRIEAISGHISEGLVLLTRAYMGCQNDKTMQSILRYLVPAKMLRGELPPDDVLQQHGLTHYLVFKEALCNGDVGLYLRSMQDLTIKMVADGTYLLWDMLVFGVYRRLVKRVYDLGRAVKADKTEQLQLDVMLGVLEQQGAPVTSDDLECMLTVLISNKYIKGYISHKSRVLVLAKAGAFPEPCPEWWMPISADNRA